ncbi:hypothetical protein [Verrucomicrobium spinosum]|uniref:hypothetical protein n=1 Tax=Verrucomicrobium spinosum TaxID=2736 RepID=UPI0004924C9C|nr:hypothetical protein [Verrucomicrobium spinosum]
MNGLFPILLCLFALAFAPVRAHAESPAEKLLDETTQFIFFSVLEGLYETGLSEGDVAQILMKKEGQTYFHFIYACPVCNATVCALQAYQARPDRFYGVKLTISTFGLGLDKQSKEMLHDEDPVQRLQAINELVNRWMAARMKKLRLTDEERSSLLVKLEEKRKEGMRALESFQRKEHGPNFGVAEAAPAYVGLEECAVCNAAVGKPMKMPKQGAR